MSEGCRFCYAERLSLEKGWTVKPWTAANAGDNVRLHPDRLTKPARWRAPRRIFVNSMSDLFHPLVPDAFIRRVFDAMAQESRHTFQVLTKRPERAADLAGELIWPVNVWMGTSIESDREADRLEALRDIPAAVRWISAEPLIGPLTVPLDGLEWIVVGGESGPHIKSHPERALRHEWVRALRDEARRVGAAFFFKQDSGSRTELRPYILEEDGSRTTVQEWPAPRPRTIGQDLSLLLLDEQPDLSPWVCERCGLPRRGEPGDVHADGGLICPDCDRAAAS